MNETITLSKMLSLVAATAFKETEPLLPKSQFECTQQLQTALGKNVPKTLMIEGFKLQDEVNGKISWEGIGPWGGFLEHGSPSRYQLGIPILLINENSST